MKRIMTFLDNLPKTILIILGFCCILFIWFFDYITGPDLSFLIFYVFPVFFIAWFAGLWYGILFSIISALAWVSADVMTRFETLDFFIIFWNTTVRLCVFIIIVYVVSSLKQVNEKLEQNILKLDDTNKELEAFNYSVSHDLKTPLIAIGGFARRLIKRYSGELDAKGVEELDIIKSNTDKMQQLIDDLLAYSRAGHHLIRKSHIDMDGLVKTVFDDVKKLSPNRTLKCIMKPLPPVEGDGLLLRQVMFNLLTNAVKFTRSRGLGIIEIGGYGNEQENIYHVKDNGVGFDGKSTHKLFNAFQRLHKKEDFEGTGLGLTIVQRIVHRHGGRVWAEAEVNEGATFYFSVPNNVK